MVFCAQRRGGTQQPIPGRLLRDMEGLMTLLPGLCIFGSFACLRKIRNRPGLLRLVLGLGHGQHAANRHRADVVFQDHRVRHVALFGLVLW